MKFYSHKDTLIADHLRSVAEYSLIYGNKDFEKINKTIAYCHDFGKYTTYFQDRLFEREKTEKKEGNHAHISAVFAAYVFLNKNLGEDFLPLLAYSAVLSHHGRVKNFDEYIPSRRNKVNRIESYDKMYNSVQILNKQKCNIKENIEYVCGDYKLFGLEDLARSFLSEDQSIEKTLFKLKGIKNSVSDRRDLYWIHHELYSTLISSDKISASKLKPLQQKYINFEELKKIKTNKFSGKPKTQINFIRNEIFEQVQKQIERYLNKRIFTITAPTGSGKTMTGLFAALKLRKLKPELKKIIYVLPYTSIIDQNYDDIAELYKEIPDVKNNEYHYIMKHHHLSNYEKDKDKEIYDESDYQMMMENWESTTIVTTFVQLMETVVGVKNKMLKKFYALRDSIILLDEVQAMDIKYFKLLNYVFQQLSEKLNCHIIIMTATKPLFFPDSFELLTEHEKYFKAFNRTKLVNHLDRRFTVEEFLYFFMENIEDKSYMIVVNTINQSLELYKLIKKVLEEDNRYSHKLYYLSTNLIPLHRNQRIEEIKDKLKSNEKIILVSTQVVEAGVNLDFNEVYRDIAPLDSIIQCAGRCNRNNGDYVGNVHIVEMVTEDERIYGDMVYGAGVVNIVKEIMDKTDIIEEKDYLDLINKYYEKIKQVKSQQTSINYINSIEKLNFDNSDKTEVGSFNLIKDNSDYLDVFIEYDEEAEKIFNDYCQAYKLQNLDKRQNKLLSLRKSMRQYMISMPKKYWKTLNPTKITENYSVLQIPQSGIESYYDLMTGYKREPDDSMIFY